MSPHLMSYAIIVPLMALMVWRRISRQFGRQPIRRKRMTARIVIFAVIGGLLMLGGLHDIRLAEGVLGGAVIGAALGLLGLRLTRFETDLQQLGELLRRHRIQVRHDLVQARLRMRLAPVAIQRQLDRRESGLVVIFRRTLQRRTVAALQEQEHEHVDHDQGHGHERKIRPVQRTMQRQYQHDDAPLKTRSKNGPLPAFGRTAQARPATFRESRPSAWSTPARSIPGSPAGCFRQPAQTPILRSAPPPRCALRGGRLFL